MSPKKILIVDDEEIMRGFLCDLLKEDGYDVDESRSGEDAILRVTQSVFDLVITDIKMQGKDGYSVLVEAKKINPRMKVLMMTGYAVNGEAEDSLLLGADGFILKPFDIANIREIIHRVIGGGNGK
jgi:DNA-binding NtrC family response regulator